MKRLTLCALLLTTLTLCAQNTQNMQTLVAYFSATGTTRAAAQKLAKQHNAVLWEIEAAEPYTAADLDWRNEQSRSSLEMKDPDERPTIKQCTDIRPYSTIYIGFPIWYAQAPRVIHTFCKNYNWEGKKIYAFATSGGSGIGKTADKLQPSASGAAAIDAKLVHSVDDICNW